LREYTARETPAVLAFIKLKGVNQSALQGPKVGPKQEAKL
jgi:hypothetical protein